MLVRCWSGARGGMLRGVRETQFQGQKTFPSKINFSAPDVEKKLSRLKKQFFEKYELSRNPLGGGQLLGVKKTFSIKVSKSHLFRETLLC